MLVMVGDKMDSKPKISESEWEVMKILWKNSPKTSEEIIDVLSSENDWSSQTIKTFITRLIKKGAIAYDRNGRKYEYYPIITEEECIKSENESFLKKVYDGALGLLFSNFLKDEDLTLEEIEELENILKEKKKKL